ncbi:MAG: LysM peptidoglycan-binding domain-containing protein [Syntrophales bacterium]
MVRIKVCISLMMILLIGCSARPITPSSGMPNQKGAAKAIPATAAVVDSRSSTEQTVTQRVEPSPERIAAEPDKIELPKTQQAKQEVSIDEEPSREKVPEQTKRSESSETNLRIPSTSEPSAKKTAVLPAKNETAKPHAKANQSKQRVLEGPKEDLEEAERDIMEEALVLLNESHTYWVHGDIEDALEMLDQAYALLIDTNGNPDMARQKDDLRLMISKRILSIYNSLPGVAKGKRSEIPLISNADVEKEIRQFQTVEREFFISSYQRSAMYRPIILRELKKAGLPEELAWLPLVESGFKISALSSARALGLWQFIPSTGYKYGLNRDDWVDERMDIEKSTRAAIDYLKELHNMFGDWLTVLAAYNCGEGRVIRTIASQHINYLDRFWDLYQKLPYETARYVPRFLATVLVIRDPQKYGIDLGTPKAPALSYEIVETNKSMRLQDIAQKLEIPEETINILNAELRHKITPDKPYVLKVPTEMGERLLKVIDDVPEAEVPRATLMAKRAVRRHKVRGGETLASIASKYKTSVSSIIDYNHLSKKHRLAAGQRLNIPIKTANTPGSSGKSKTKKADNDTRIKVQKGDTLASLARKYDTTITDLRKSNSLKSDQLKPGQILRIDRLSSEENKQQKRSGGDTSVAKGNAAPTPGQGKNKEVAGKVKKYTVKKGDNLNKIARENNISLDKLLELNSLARKNSIQPGQVILIQ